MATLSERGYFWWSDTEIPPDHFAPKDGAAGLLTITDVGRINIELEGSLPNPRGRWAVLDQADIPGRKGISGLLHKDNRYILAKNLHRSGSSFSTNGFGSEAFGALYCLIGREPIPHRTKVRSLECDLAGYEEWLRLGRLAEKRTARGLTLKHQAKPDLVFRNALGRIRLTRRASLDQDVRNPKRFGH